MNIIEAAQALRIGKKVKRSYWDNGRYLGGNSAITKYYSKLGQERNILIDCDDLLSDDWEVYEEKSPMQKAWEKHKCYLNNMSKRERDVSYGAWCDSWLAAEKHFKNLTTTPQ